MDMSTHVIMVVVVASFVVECSDIVLLLPQLLEDAGYAVKSPAFV